MIINGNGALLSTICICYRNQRTISTQVEFTPDQQEPLSGKTAADTVEEGGILSPLLPTISEPVPHLSEEIWLDPSFSVYRTAAAKAEMNLSHSLNDDHDPLLV